MGISLTGQGITFPDGTQQTTAKYGSYRNRIVNGNMAIAQRATSFAAAANGQYTLDRWVFANSTAGVVTISQYTEPTVPVIGNPITDTPSPELGKSLQIEVTTADTSIITTDFATIGQRIEGINVADLIDRDFTVSFYMRTNFVGTFCMSLRNAAGDFSYVRTFVQDTSGYLGQLGWEHQVFIIEGGLPSTTTWDTSTGIGLRLEITLVSGSTYYVGNDAQWYPSTTGLATSTQSNAFATVGNKIWLTGVQLEPNRVPIPKYDLRQDAVELNLCQRYYAQTGASIRGIATIAGQNFTGTVFFPQLMRALPVCTKSAFSETNITASAISDITLAGARFNISSAAAGITYSVYGLITANSEL